MTDNTNTPPEGSATSIEEAARAMAKHAGWEAWDTATDFTHTLSGNEPEEEREYWRELAALALARATPQHSVTEQATVPDHIVYGIAAYGNERADDDPKSAATFGNIITDIRALLPSTAASKPEQALTAAVDAAMVEMANISPPLRRSECARLIRAALAIPASTARIQPESATKAEVHTLRRLIECAEKLDARPRPMCRDCADENGTCPNSGLECDMRKLFADAKALHNRLAVPAATAATQPEQANPSLTDEEIDKVRAAKRIMVDALIASNMRYGACGVISNRLENLISTLATPASTAASEKVGALDPLTIKSAIAAIAKRLTNDSIGQYAEPAEDGDDAGKRNYDAGKFGGINDLMREVERWLDANIATPAASEQQAGADERTLNDLLDTLAAGLRKVNRSHDVEHLIYQMRDVRAAVAALTHRATTATTDALRLIRDTACFDSTPSGAAYYRMAENALAAIECRDAATPDIATTAADQQQEKRCTCPSGDGSLRWPCPQHPPEATTADQQGDQNSSSNISSNSGAAQAACLRCEGRGSYAAMDVDTKAMGDVPCIECRGTGRTAQGQASDDARAGVRDAIAEALSNVYYCGRAWSAWGVGTMSEDDFTPAAEVDEVLDGLTDAAIAAMAP